MENEEDKSHMKSYGEDHHHHHLKTFKQKRRKGKCRRNVVTINLENDWQPERLEEVHQSVEEHDVGSPQLNTISHKKLRNKMTATDEPFITEEVGAKSEKGSGKRPSYLRDHRCNTSKVKKKWIRLATVLAYVVAVSLAAVSLAVYYSLFWHPENQMKQTIIAIHPLTTSAKSKLFVTSAGSSMTSSNNSSGSGAQSPSTLPWLPSNSSI